MVTTKNTGTELNGEKTKYMFLSHQQDMGQSSENVLGSKQFEQHYHIKIICVMKLRAGFKYGECLLCFC
jgi:hypothetical protein